MKLLRPIAILSCCLLAAAGASAQISLTPPAVQAPAPASKPAAKKEAPKETLKETPKPKAPAVAKKPAATPKPAATATPAPVFDDPNVDLVYGAYQRGLYKTALDLAMTRAQYAGDAKAMT